MDPAQLVNGIAAGFAAYIWLRLLPATFRSDSTVARLSGSIAFGASSWYSAINLALGTGLLDLELTTTVPLFRYAFPFIVAAPAVRSRALLNKEHELIEQIVRIRPDAL